MGACAEADGRRAVREVTAKDAGGAAVEGAAAGAPLVRVVKAKLVISRSNLPVCDYSVNPYTGCSHACKYCYASFMRRFTDHPEPWGGFVDVKRWPPIASPRRYAGKGLFVGSVCDPYMPEEARYLRTRALLEQLRGSGARLSIQTKSDLVLRDLDLIREFPDARVGFSINTLDEDFRREMDHAVSIGRRVEAMCAFHDAGVRTTCFVSPIFPGITDVPAIVRLVRDHCNLIWLENLNLRGDYKARILRWVHERHPELDGLYDEIYRGGSRAYWEALDAELRGFAAGEGLEYVVNDDTLDRPFDAAPVMVNFFYHERIKRSRGASRESAGAREGTPDGARRL
ncbi:MAG: radical SAM protein [Coriobacteriales bacterium]|jgi:radical SAM mobile pair protein B